jgi:hypothetical protein
MPAGEERGAPTDIDPLFATGAINALVGASIVSITLNTILHRVAK